MSYDTRRSAATRNESRTGFRGRRVLSRALPALLIVAAPLAMTVATYGSSGAISGDGDSTSAGRYERLWDKQSAANKRWARRTSECESGGNRKIHDSSGTYHGAFQFMKSTWKSAPKSPGGDPHRYPWKTQAVVAIYLKKRDGTGHWPNCG
jgi:hypothetical protein